MPLVAEPTKTEQGTATATESRSISSSANTWRDSGNGHGQTGAEAVVAVAQSPIYGGSVQLVTMEPLRSETGEGGLGPERERLIEALTWRYSVRDYASVVALLRSDPMAVPVLLVARNLIEKFFGASVELTLARETDPEAEGESELVARIVSDYPPQEAAARLAEFDRKWWLRTSYETRTKLSITLGYR